MLRSWKTCKPSNTSFNSLKKYAFRSSVVTSIFATPTRNKHFSTTLSKVSRILLTLVGSCPALELSFFTFFIKRRWISFAHTHTHTHTRTYTGPPCFTSKVCTNVRWENPHTHTHTHRPESVFHANDCDSRRNGLFLREYFRLTFVHTFEFESMHES